MVFRRRITKRKSGGKTISYEFADDIRAKVVDVVQTIPELDHLKFRLDSISCIRSYYSGSRGTIARCHALSKVMQISLNRDGYYVLEFIHERYDNLSEDDKFRTIIHELMHVPKAFGGGFKHHDWVNEKNVELFFKKYKSLKNNSWF
ncbi:hypothetical protein COU61_01620 [Candidatus Pacearchaeota archaeon CG10_big_fil_rev_8_21_14_0_10_35_13]|nr:MAG: hypothetical protein COU61_01620 [Candidatus Pacearchaeota archaeon CG10_big_fil_rev_8_21_14_0_10_35_13]